MYIVSGDVRSENHRNPSDERLVNVAAREKEIIYNYIYMI